MGFVKSTSSQPVNATSITGKVAKFHLQYY